MSDFHGGFFVQAVDGKVAEPIRLALSRALRARKLDEDRHRLTFAARRGCPVMHVAVRGPRADGKDYAFFHAQYADLGADVARAAGAKVWAYHYENQVGSEGVRAFDADGSDLGDTSCSWDDLDDMDAAPLTALADELGVERSVLEADLAYDTPPVSVELVGADCTRAVTAYLTGPLLPSRGGQRTSELDARQTLYFPRSMADELDAIAERLGVQLGYVAWAAWEAGKPELYRTVPIFEADESAPNRFLVPPPVQPPATIRVPREAPRVPASTGGDDKVALKLALPERVLQELQDFATATDRSLSWSLQKAFKLVRDRMHAATRA